MYKLIIYVVDFTIKVSIVALNGFSYLNTSYIYLRLLTLEILSIIFLLKYYKWIFINANMF